ncbi:bacterial proteasome activator family protein [Pengzhenrongella frigida]|uniref:Bacterial proteasome activator n=1 Tax=Pengzhenrongella frigida TaxID=1259133 RepID=A0A4Q5N0M6_9MICO|nr:bacterial proteasome activator family protein [Cellulomonas sp. HLT2-17]RYV51590.1 bacterial proteasome activator family protein [Cellulomonas sp. HLT2-17]
MIDSDDGPAVHPTDPDTPVARGIVVGPDDRGWDEARPGDRAAVARSEDSSGAAGAGDEPGENPAELVDQPAKVMRIGTMIKQLLEEVRSAPLDEAARTRLAAVHERSLHELEDGLSPELVAELHRITLPLGADGIPSDAELRIAQAQLVGWLEGLFHGIQTALVAQQMAAQSQLAHMRRGLPPGLELAPGTAPALPQAADGPGQYL